MTTGSRLMTDAERLEMEGVTRDIHAEARRLLALRDAEGSHVRLMALYPDLFERDEPAIRKGEA